MFKGDLGWDEKIAIRLKGKSAILSIKPLLHMSCFVLVLTASAGGLHSFFDSLFAQLGSPRCNAVTRGVCTSEVCLLIRT